jgi:hypothetical protein
LAKGRPLSCLAAGTSPRRWAAAEADGVRTSKTSADSGERQRHARVSGACICHRRRSVGGRFGRATKPPYFMSPPPECRGAVCRAAKPPYFAHQGHACTRAAPKPAVAAEARARRTAVAEEPRARARRAALSTRNTGAAREQRFVLSILKETNFISSPWFTCLQPFHCACTRNEVTMARTPKKSVFKLMTSCP